MNNNIVLLIRKLKTLTSENRLLWQSTSDPEGYSCLISNKSIFIKKFKSKPPNRRYIEFNIFIMNFNGEILDRIEIKSNDNPDDNETYIDMTALFNLAQRRIQGQGDLIEEILSQL